jgi:hypothetical protein
MLRIFPYRAQKNVIYSRNVMRNKNPNLLNGSAAIRGGTKRKKILTKVKCWDNIIENAPEEYFEE